MTISVDVVVKKYLEFRDEKARIEEAAKTQTRVVVENMDKLEAWLRLKAEAEGVESFRTDFGTAFFATVDFAQVADWSSTLPYIIKNEAWDLLEKRVSKTAVRAIINETKAVPPGINYGTKRELNVRKPSKAKEQ